MRNPVNGGKERRARTAAAFLAALAAALLLPPAQARAFTGGRPGEIFTFGAGARPLAMGGAYTAVSGDAAAVYYNPSGLALLPGRLASFMHASLYEGAAYDYLGYAQNFGAVPGGWGGQILRLSGGQGDGRDENNLPTSDFSYTETAFALGAGVRGLPHHSVSAGASVKLVNRALGDHSDNLFGVDLGAQYGPLAGGRLTLGLAVQNAVSFASGDTDDKLPVITRAGATYAVLPGAALSVDVAGDGSFRVGTEYALGAGALRAGYDRDMFTFGGGIKLFGAYQFDIAMVRHAELGVSQRISLGYNFGRAAAAPTRPVVYAGEFLARAEAGLRGRRYGEALRHIDMAAGLDAGSVKGPLAEKRARLAAMTAELGMDRNPDLEKYFRGGEPQAEEAALSLAEYLEGRGLRAFLLAQSAAGYAPNEAFYSDYLRAAAKLTGNEPRKGETLPRRLLVQEKFKKAAAAFYVQRFEYSARQCEEILLLDELNALAWTRLGSAYFMMGDRERARTAYLKALELNPQDSATANFIKEQGWK